MPSKIFVKGARENNLKNIDVEIPRDALTVITGLSGSGKSSLAFDTIYAEGQRRYVESLSSYARMFLGQKEKPDVDYIEGLSPAISIDQKTTSQNPRSTVGTVTEVYDYLRLLWARVGTPHCPNCGKEIRQQSIDQIIDQLMALGEGTRVQIMAPVIRGKKGEHVKIFEDARRSGYVRVRADGDMYDLSEEISLEKNKKHNIEVVVDRLILRPDVVHRLTDSCETAAALSGGLILANILPDDRDILFSQNYACEDCGISIEELTPRMFSFNNPFGACPTCTGLGTQLKVDPELVIPNKIVSLLDGAICASGWNNVRGDGISRMYFEALSKKYHFSLRDPVEKLSKEVMDVILYGTKGEKLELQYDQPRGKGVLYQAFEGIIPNLERRYKETRRQHPLAAAEKIPITEAIARERRLLQPLRDKAKYVIDTSLLSAAQNRERVCSLFLDKGESPMELMVVSFGFKYGLPQEADLVLDVRCLPNPFYVPELKHKTGLDQEVVDYVMASEESQGLLHRYEYMLEYALPLYVKEGKSQLMIAVGCTGGKHRSITFARKIGEFCKKLGYAPSVQHRDVNRSL